MTFNRTELRKEHRFIASLFDKDSRYSVAPIRNEGMWVWYVHYEEVRVYDVLVECKVKSLALLYLHCDRPTLRIKFMI